VIPVVAPLTGTVVDISIVDGDLVHEGQELVIIEAMKMHHAVTAPEAGIARLDGIVEMPASRRFIVITVLIRAGFPAVEAEAAACGGQVRARASSTCAAPVSVVSRPQ